MKRIGRVSELVRYPVKSMAGVPADSAFLGLHGLAGDRRFAFRRLDASGDERGFPWLSASRLPELLLFHPTGIEERDGEPLPTHIRTPSGETVALRSAELTNEIARRLGNDVELMKLRHGIFDDACISVISRTTIAEISNSAGVPVDTRRFRANIVLEAGDPIAFQEDGWVGGTLVFGEEPNGPAVTVTARDVRCVMISLAPDTAERDDRMLKTAVRLNGNNAGVYGTVVQTGVIRVGDPVSLRFAI